MFTAALLLAVSPAAIGAPVASATAPGQAAADLDSVWRAFGAATAAMDAAAEQRERAAYAAAVERVERLAPGLEQAVLDLLAPAEAGGGRDWSSEQIRTAWECGVALAESGRLGAAAAIQRELHDELEATWTVLNLSLTLTRSQAYEEADRLLVAQLGRSEAEPERAALVYQRALVALARGDERAGRDFLGWALRLGSEDAHVVLAWLQLHSGRPASARALARARLRSESPGNTAWALRGWTLSLLPRDRRLDVDAGRQPVQSQR